MISDLLKHPPTLETLAELRDEIIVLPARQFAETLASNAYKSWHREHEMLIKHLRRAEATANMARRARHDSMLLESVQPILQEIRT